MLDAFAHLGVAIFGFFVGCFLLTQPIIITVFGIPFAKHLLRERILTSNAPLRTLRIGRVLQLMLLLAITCAFWSVAGRWQVPYYIGVGVAFFLSLGKFGANEDNIRDFLQGNREHIDFEKYKDSNLGDSKF